MSRMAKLASISMARRICFARDGRELGSETWYTPHGIKNTGSADHFNICMSGWRKGLSFAGQGP